MGGSVKIHSIEGRCSITNEKLLLVFSSLGDQLEIVRRLQG